MGRKRINPRLLKLHRCYTAPELAQTLGVHPGTVRLWQRKGLHPIDEKRPALFKGVAAKHFLELQRSSRKNPCGPGRLFCFRCNAPQAPAMGMADYIAFNPQSGNLKALCGTCGGAMHRRARLAKLDAAMPGITIQIQQDQTRLNDRPHPCLNTESTKGAKS